MSDLFFSVQRSIGAIIPQITIEELHRDELRTTEHPVEQGANITDHAFKENPSLEMRIGYSDAGHGFGYAKDMYDQLLDLQETRQPITVNSGKRYYVNMLITGISTETVEDTEMSLVISVRLKQIMIVSLQYTTVPALKDQAQPSKTAGTANTGDRQTQTPPQDRVSAGGTLLGPITGKLYQRNLTTFNQEAPTR